MKLIDKIISLKKERNAVILAHNYELPEIQDIADFTGDSLGLSIEASRTKAEVIVFCGVYFMAETAKILSPEKKVIIPDAEAGCPLADMITVEQLRELKRKHPKAKTICYVNTKAEIKAECDYCCTSANAVKMLREAFSDEDEIIFVPDKQLAGYAAKKTGRNVIIWEGGCPSHINIKKEDILALKERFPKAKVITHPECIQEVVNLSDEVLSTSGMLRFVKQSKDKEFIVATEIDMIHALKKGNPDKLFYPASQSAFCHNMKKITLEKLANSLEKMEAEIVLSNEIILNAKKSIKNMISVLDSDRVHLISGK